MKFQKILSGFFPAYLLILCLLLAVGLFGNYAVSAIGEGMPVRPTHTVIVDAGHGGVDGGATSYSGALESGINLQIASKLNDLLHLLGIRTVMIRTTDTSIYTEGESIAAKKISDLKQRVKIVNETENALLVSIHQNYFGQSIYRGAQVFYSPREESRLLAKALQADLVSYLNPGSRRTAKKADGVYLMDNIKCPGILVECGFLSNPEEDYLLQDSTYQNKICSVIAAAISRYFQSGGVT